MDFLEELHAHEEREEKRLADRASKTEERFDRIELSLQGVRSDFTTFKAEMTEPLEAWRAVRGTITLLKWLSALGAIFGAIWAALKDIVK